MVRFFGVDAFTAEVFRGNPAVVCLLDPAGDPAGDPASDPEADGTPGDAWMRRVAAEFNQPITAFVRQDADTFRLRWFTPVQEVPLCGHGTLAAAHVLYETGTVSREDEIHFRAAGGALSARHDGDRVWMDFPASYVVPDLVPDEVLDALGLGEVSWFGRNDHEYIVEVESPEHAEKIEPDYRRVAGLPVSRVVVTAAGSTSDADFTSRVFAPVVGLDEDHVTGSAHAVLGPLWAARLGRVELTAVQASPRRGEVSMVVRDGRVLLGGRAVSTYRGELVI